MGLILRRALGRGPSRVEAGEGCKCHGVCWESEDPLPRMTLDPGREGDDLLDDGFHPSPLGRMPWWGIWSEQGFLADHAQDVVGQGTQGKEEIVGGKLPRRQTLQIQIRLDLCMELLMGGMIGVQREDRLRVETLGQRCVPAFKGIFRHQQLLAVGEGRPFRQAQDPAYRDRAQRFRAFPKRDPLPLPRTLPAGSRILQAGGDEPIQVVAAAIPFDEESQIRPLGLVCTGIARQGGGDGLAVKAGIHAYQDRLPGEAQGSGQNTVQGLVGRFSAVLGSFPQFHAKVPTLLPQVSGNRGIADKTRVGPADPFLSGVGMVEGKDIQIQWDIATGQRGDRRPSPLQQPGQRRVYYRQKCLGMAIQALPQGGTGRYASQSQGAGEESVLAESFDGLKVALALAKQAHQGHEDVAVGNARAHGQGRVYELRHLCEAMQGLTDEAQSSQGGQRATTLLEDKFCGFHVHPLGEMRIGALYHAKQNVAPLSRVQTHGSRLLPKLMSTVEILSAIPQPLDLPKAGIVSRHPLPQRIGEPLRPVRPRGRRHGADRRILGNGPRQRWQHRRHPGATAGPASGRSDIVVIDLSRNFGKEATLTARLDPACGDLYYSEPSAVAGNRIVVVWTI